MEAINLISEDGSGQAQEEHEGCDDGDIEEEDFSERLLLPGDGKHQPGGECSWCYHEWPDAADHDQEG